MLLDEAGVLPYFQPIVRLSDEQRVGFELLARSRLPGLEDPGKMFKAADARGQEVRLSEVIRMAGVFAAVHCELSGLIFLNTHPAELGKPELQNSLQTLRTRFPDASLVIEVHEAAATSSAYLLELRKLTTSLDIGLAYDDFGAGQSRLLELTEVPPDYVKFDMHLIRGLATCSEGRRSMVSNLVRAVHDLNVPALAEGVETQEEASICRDLGFDLGQGFYYGRPDAASSFVRSDKD